MLNIKWPSIKWPTIKRPSLAERNKLLEVKAEEAEARAELLEEEAKLRKRLLSAKQRCKEARQGAGISTFKWVVIAFVAALILFAMFKGC